MVKLCSFATEVQLINKPTYTLQHGCTCENLCIRKNLVDKRPPNGNDYIEWTSLHLLMYNGWGSKKNNLCDLWIRNALVQQRMKKLFVNEGSAGNIRIMPHMSSSSSFHIAKTFFAFSNKIQVRLTNHCKGGC